MAIKPISLFPKFTNIPNWATYVAQHADGEWWFYESLPKLVVNIGFKSHDRTENQMPANIKTNPDNWETTATNIKSLNEWSYQDVYGKSLPERFILLGPDGEKLPSPIILKTTSSLKALNTYLNDRNFDYFKQRSHDIEALSIYDTKLNKTIEILFKASPTFWQRTSHPETSSKYRYMFNNKLTEAKSTIKLDSFSASDSDKISDFLNTEKIPFKKVGPIFTISLDRNTPKASVILSQLRRISKFDEVNESISNFEKGPDLSKLPISESNKSTSKSVTELIESIVSQTILEAYEPVMYDPNIHKTLDSGAMDFEFNAANPNTIQVFAPFKEEPNVMVHMKISKKYFDDLLDNGYIESQEDLDSMEMNYDNLRGAVVTLMKRPELLKRYLVMQENVISELNLSAAGVKEFLMFIKRYPKYLEELGFVSFKVLLDTIKSGDVNVVYDLMQEILPVLKKETNPKIKQDAMALMH